MTVEAARAVDRTKRFAQRRSQIVETASRHINRYGARGMTLTSVAKALDLDTSSVAYYFKRKDQLAAACFERTLLWLRDTATRAGTEPDPSSRVRAFLAAHFALHYNQRATGASELALTSDLRALGQEVREPLDALYAEIFAIVRCFFPAEGERGGSASAIAATHLLASVHWLPAWIDRYQLRDFSRVEARLFDVLVHGIYASAAAAPAAIPVDENPPEDSAQARFLTAATRLINRHGYAGASVERIAAELGVSTGSFYHHLDNKDDLVLACFRRSFATIEAAQARGDAEGRTEGERLAIAAALLVTLQFNEESPLLRMSAYQALPLDLRGQMLTLAGQVTRHVAGTIADGVADGSLRPVDPLIASQTVMAAISAAPDLRRWAAPRQRDAAVSTYLAPLWRGLFA